MLRVCASSLTRGVAAALSELRATSTLQPGDPPDGDGRGARTVWRPGQRGDSHLRGSEQRCRDSTLLRRARDDWRIAHLWDFPFTISGPWLTGPLRVQVRDNVFLFPWSHLMSSRLTRPIQWAVPIRQRPTSPGASTAPGTSHCARRSCPGQ